MSENLFVQIDIVVQLFSMVLQNLWLQKCPHCESNYETKDSFILLPMPIVRFNKRWQKSASKSNHSVGLRDFFVHMIG